MIVQEILSRQFDPEQFDRILLKLVDQVLEGQRDNPDYQGMVGACVIDPDGRQACSTSIKENNKWVHAERAALNACETVSGDCMIVTTLSPCNSPVDDRAGESCADLIKYYNIGLSNVYCGYKDPTQEEDGVEETNNPKLRELCKRLADTFLKDNQVNEISDERLQDYLSRADRIKNLGPDTLARYV